MRKLKLLSLSLLISLSFVSGAFASNPNEILAKFTDFNFKVNGQTVSLSDKPIDINGKSYLPVRAVSQLLGYNVDYDPNTMTIGLTNQNSKVVDPASNNSTEATTFNGLNAIIVNGQIYVSALDYTRKLESLSKNTSKPENSLSFDSGTKNTSIIFNDKVDTVIPMNADNIQIIKGRTYINSKYYKLPH